MADLINVMDYITLENMMHFTQFTKLWFKSIFDTTAYLNLPISFITVHKERNDLS
jgi:hypothetical protein